MQTVRVRNNAKVTHLNIPEETIALIEEIKGTFFGNKNQVKYIKRLLGHSLCCLCSGIPSIELSYDLGGFRKIEMYCTLCASSLYERNDPEDRDKLAEHYGCIAVDELPKTPTES